VTTESEPRAAPIDTEMPDPNARFPWWNSLWMVFGVVILAMVACSAIVDVFDLPTTPGDPAMAH